MGLTVADKTEVRQIVREETDDMRLDIRVLKVEFENFGSKLDTIVEYISDDAIHRQVKQHDYDIDNLKADMQIVKAHIKQKP